MSIEFGPSKYVGPVDLFDRTYRDMSSGNWNYPSITMSLPSITYNMEIEKFLFPKKKVDMSNADQKLQEELEVKRQEAELERKRAAIESIGLEPTDTNYVAFTKKFEDHENATVYSYAAVKLFGKSWYTTTSNIGGRTSYYESWDALVLFLVSGPVPTESVVPLYPKPTPSVVIS